MDLIKELESQQMKAEKPVANVGDTVRVHVKIKEGSRERIQVFEGIVIAKKHGGIEETITVRRLAYGVGVEKVFPLHSPSIEKIETVRTGFVRRAKLYYLRDRVRLPRSARSCKKSKIETTWATASFLFLLFFYVARGIIHHEIFCGPAPPERWRNEYERF